MIAHVKQRLNERSTWIAIGGGVAAAATLATPWSYLAFVIGVVAALVPDGQVTG
jgi:hypothetical protein